MLQCDLSQFLMFNVNDKLNFLALDFPPKMTEARRSPQYVPGLFNMIWDCMILFYNIYVHALSNCFAFPFPTRR